MLQPLDGPSLQNVILVDSVTVKEVKIGAFAMVERKVITLQPDDKIRVYFGDSDAAAPSAAIVLTNGFKHHKNTIRSYEASSTQPIYILSDTGASVNVIVAERA